MGFNAKKTGEWRIVELLKKVGIDEVIQNIE